MDYRYLYQYLIIAFAFSADAGTGDYSVPAKTEDGADRTGRRSAVTFEKGRNAHHGRRDHSDSSVVITSVFYVKGLSEDYPDLISDAGIWI